MNLLLSSSSLWGVLWNGIGTIAALPVVACGWFKVSVGFKSVLCVERNVFGIPIEIRMPG